MEAIFQQCAACLCHYTLLWSHPRHFHLRHLLRQYFRGDHLFLFCKNRVEGLAKAYRRILWIDSGNSVGVDHQVLFSLIPWAFECGRTGHLHGLFFGTIDT